MLLQWLEVLASFDFKVQHRKKLFMVGTRAPHMPYPTAYESKILINNETAVASLKHPGLSLEELLRAHAEDRSLL